MENFNTEICINDRIASLRKEKNMTQDELARELSVTRQTISSWERGASCPSLADLKQIAVIFEVDYNNLLTGVDVEGSTLIREGTEFKRMKKIPFSIPMLIFEILAGLIFLTTIIIVAIKYSKLPDRVPMHFNALGEVDAWAGKGTVWISPAMMSLIYVMLSVGMRFPQLYNIPVNLTTHNQKPVLRMMGIFASYLKFHLCANFATMSICMVFIKNLPSWFLGVGFGGLFVALAVFLVLIFKTASKYKTPIDKEKPTEEKQQ